MDKQIFQTDSRSRWKKFQWSMRVIGAIIVLFIIVFLTLFALEGSPKIPFVHDYHKVMTAEKPLMRNNETAKEYKSFRRFFHEKKMHTNYAEASIRKTRFTGKRDQLTEKYLREWNDPRMGIRAAWYVNWDKRSLLSLKRNISHINLLMGEWLFINPKTGVLNTQVDKKALRLAQKAGVPVMAMLTNNYGEDFRSEAIGSIMKDAGKRKLFTEKLLAACRKYNFCGINIDLEDLQINDNALLTTFVSELSAVFHKEGLYVTQDVAPFNEDYDMEQLAKCNDYLFLMAYDEHNSASKPGDVCSQQFVERATDWAARNIPNDKLVLGLAAYGYDWCEDKQGETVTFNQAVASALNAGAPIDFNEDSYNLNFSYIDDNNKLHQVYLTDAATSYNIMRFGAEYHLAGFSVWRLGTEDSRIWNFYGKDMSYENTSNWNLQKLLQIRSLDDVNFVGNGEVLQVESEPQPGYISIVKDKDDGLVANEIYRKLPSNYTVTKIGRCHAKDLVITFDDGPDSKWTPQVLSILKEHHVPAAFFMVGLQMEKNLPLVRKVYEAGHTIGNHTFTHHNVIENSDDRTYAELKLTRMLIESITGHSTILFRAPYNADSDPTQHEEIEPMILASRRNYLMVGESIDPNDWKPGVTADQIYQRVTDGVHHEDGHIILLHDAGGVTRKATIQALPRIITTLQKEGYRFISLEEYLGMKRETLMPTIQKGKAYYAMQMNLTLAEFIYHLSDFITALFLVFLVLGFMRLIFMYGLVIKEKRIERRRNYDNLGKENMPKVSIIVPAYNEEVNVVNTIYNLIEQDYPLFDIVAVDDGSKDHTLARLKEKFGNHPKVAIFTKPNGGKAAALNFGLSHTDADFVVCIDADTQLRHDALSKLMRHFAADKEKRVGAVAGNVKVGNCRNMLTNWQAIEYITSQNFDRMAYSAINAITVVPGAIGAFRKEAMEKAGYFTTDTLAEDCDLTMRIIEAGYVIENENHAVAMTEAPENIRQFVKQRTRWCFGVMQTFWKHRRNLFRSRYKGFGLWALPNMLVFQYIIPTFSPIADVLMLAGLFSGNAWQIFIYYLIFLIVDASVSIMAFIVERESLWTLLWIIPQRFFYRWIMYYVIFKSYFKAIKGELQQWGVLKRTGNVKI